MKPNEFIHKKRAIYTGLKPFLEEHQLMEALILWEKKFAHSPTFSVRYFIAELMRHVDPGLTTKQVLVHLVSTMALPENELYPDPTSAMNAYQKGRQQPLQKPGTPPAVATMQCLINAWLPLIPPGSSIEIVRFVSRSLTELDIDTGLKHKVVDWLANRNHTIRIKKVDLTGLRKIINLFYIATCEYIGPMAADSSLAKAAAQVREKKPHLANELGKLL